MDRIIDMRWRRIGYNCDRLDVRNDWTQMEYDIHGVPNDCQLVIDYYRNKCMAFVYITIVRWFLMRWFLCGHTIIGW